MSSIIEGYNYDIFISYRQKDNKGDRWVSEFVEALKTELESTFKEEISVYFDISPNDGLLQTHDVDASLKDKLKCLIFIPIISRTYCDPKSFAWDHELKEFISQATDDKFGLKVRLSNGNVASRILPVRIHDLDSTDIKLCESVIDSVLRGIEFIYREPGVNRPLRSHEENPQDNLNHTIFRNQINKVANAIREIISGLQKIKELPPEETEDESGITEEEVSVRKNEFVIEIPEERPAEQPSEASASSKKKGWLISLTSLFIAILANIIYFSFSNITRLPFSERDWIIITDFDNRTRSQAFDNSLNAALNISMSQSRHINLLMRSEIIRNLVLNGSAEQTFVDEKTGREIAIKEGINLCILPVISELGNRYIISAKIIEAKSSNLLKSEILYRDSQDKILSGVDKLSKKIRRDLGESRFEIELNQRPLAKAASRSLEALRYYSLGIEKQISGDFTTAKSYFDRALNADSGFTAARAALGRINFEESDPVTGMKLLDRAVKDADNMTERERLDLLAFYSARVENDLSKAVEYSRARMDLYPDDLSSRHNLGCYYLNSGEIEKALKEFKEVIRIDSHAVSSYVSLIKTYLEYLGDADSALIWSEKMVSGNPQNVLSYTNVGSSWFCLDSLSRAEVAFNKAYNINSNLIENLYNMANTYRLLQQHDKAISILRAILSISQNESDAWYQIGINYQNNGNYGEARNYFTGFQKMVKEKGRNGSSYSAENLLSLAAVSARLGNRDTSELLLQKAVVINSALHERIAGVLCLQNKIPEALDELERAFGNGYRNLYRVKISPDLQVLHNDNGYKNMLGKYFNKPNN
jgi:tetratricopeptide (TPR) repeat protein